MFFSRAKSTLVAPDEALPGRTEQPFRLAERHLVLDAPLVTDEVPDGHEVAVFGLGCFWGAEEIFWQVPGVWSTSVGYAGGFTAAPVVRRGLLGTHRPHRGRAGRLRPRDGLVRRPGPRLLRGARPDPGHAPGQRRRHAVPLGDLLHHARAGGDGARDHQASTARSWPASASTRSPPRSHRWSRRRTTTPRTTTSSTSPRTPTATAATPRPVSRSRADRVVFSGLRSWGR